MKKGLIVGGIIISIIVIITMIFANTYNGLINKQEEVKGKLADISVQLERRADLIPNLVSTVKGYAAHETEVINSITSSREKLLNANSAEEMAEANQELNTALNKLLVIVENYPDLKANTNFIQLQDELAGTENRIAVARQDYNEAVKDYNKAIKSFPKNIIAGMFDFEEKEYFEAKDESNEVPEVSFE